MKPIVVPPTSPETTDFVVVQRQGNLALVSVTEIGTSGLIIENRTDDPASLEVGRIWLRTDL